MLSKSYDRWHCGVGRIAQPDRATVAASRGLSVRNAERSGIFLFAVDGFEVSGGNYIDNGEYGRFPRCSRDGLIAINSGGFGSSNNTVITRNVIRQNGRNPDPRTRGSGDIVYLDNPANGSCISDNVFKTSDEPFGEPPACS